MDPPGGNAAGPSCEGHDHYPIVVINDVFNYNVDNLFKAVFDDSPVQQKLSKQKGRTDVVWNPWKLEADGFKRRDVTYTVTIPSQSKPFHFTEKQVLYPESKPGVFYFVDAECISANVPYGDSFSVLDRCYISQISDGKCHLCVTCDINFSKTVWAPVKSVITDMATDGISKYFKFLAELLRKEDPANENSDSESSVIPVVASASNLELEAATEYLDARGFFTTGIIYFLFTCSIFCLVCVTGVLFYGLWSSVNRISFMSTKHLSKQRTAHLHVYNRNPVENIADDLVAQLSELLASATRLIETTTESLEELTEKESKLQKGLQKELKEQEEQKEEVCLNN